MLTGGTDVHLALVDLREARPELSGKQAEDRLHEIGITVNRNAVPFDPRPPMEASGLRIGTPALATRGLQHEDFVEVGQIIAAALTPGFEGRAGELSARVRTIVERYPLYEELSAPAPASPLSAPARDAAGGRAAHARRTAAHTTPAPAMLWARRCTHRARRAVRLPAAATVTALLTPLTMRLARTVGAIDQPRERGLADRPTPLLGGLAIFAGALLAGLIWLPDEGSIWHGVLLAAAVITLVGALDDRFDLPRR